MSTAIQPSEIEKELERIWDSLQGTNKMRACLFNLIIFSKKGQREGYLEQLAQKMIEKFPSRIIFITNDRDQSESSLTTSVSVMSANEGESEIVCDLIKLDVSGEDSKRVPFIILPHIIPDLPVYLVYADDPCHDDPLSKRMESFASRIIFDSESTENLSFFATKILDHHTQMGVDIADLNWARIECWRELLVQSFQVNDGINHLKSATSITIEYNSLESEYLCHTRTQSIFLLLWLATRLNWSLETIDFKEGAAQLTFKKENGESLTAHMNPGKHDSIPSGRIVSLEINTADEYHYKFYRKSHSPQHITIEVSTPSICRLPLQFIMEKEEKGQSLVKEVCHKGTSKHFLELLELLASREDISPC